MEEIIWGRKIFRGRKDLIGGSIWGRKTFGEEKI